MYCVHPPAGLPLYDHSRKSSALHVLQLRILHPGLVTLRIALLMIQCTTSLIPMGLTPGCLSCGISWQAVSAARPDGSTCAVLMRLVMAARASHRSFDALWNAVHMWRHPVASTPDGPCSRAMSLKGNRVNQVTTDLNSQSSLGLWCMLLVAEEC